MATPARPPKTTPTPPARAARIVREYGPFEGAERIHGVTHDGERVWAATGTRLVALDPRSGTIARTLDRAGDAGTAFDGTHLYQIVEARIDKIDPASGAVVASIPAPGRGGDSGLAWAEGCLWVGQYLERRIRAATSFTVTPQPDAHSTSNSRSLNCSCGTGPVPRSTSPASFPASDSLMYLPPRATRWIASTSCSGE